MERLPSHLQAFVELLTRPPSRHRFFRTAESRLELMDIIRGLTDHLVETGTTNLILLDRAARPLAVGLAAYWRNMKIPPPATSIYFLNPLGFQSREFHQRDIDAWERFEWKVRSNYIQSRLGDLDYDPIRPSIPRSKAKIREDFQTKMARLYDGRAKKTVVADTCVHTGYWIKPVTNTLQDLGFSNFETVVVSDHTDRSSLAKPNVCVLDHIPDKRCYPFDHETLVRKDIESVCSVPISKDTVDANERLAYGVQVRREIRGIVDSYTAFPGGI